MCIIKNGNRKNHVLYKEPQVLISTRNLQSDQQVESLIHKMNITTKYLIVNQSLDYKGNIKDCNVITRCEKGLSKSRNTAIENASNNIVLLADDDVIYEDNYKDVILNAYDKYENADIICFYVESLNKKRKIKRMPTGKVGYIKAMRIVSFEISFKRDIIMDKNLKFKENLGAGTKLGRGEELDFICSAIRAGLKVMFVNKKIAQVEQKESTWFKRLYKAIF